MIEIEVIRYNIMTIKSWNIYGKPETEKIAQIKNMQL